MTTNPTLYLMTGNTGAGKSTVSKQMAIDLPAFYLSHDGLLVLAYGDHIESLDFKECCARMDNLIWKQAEQMFRLNIDMVIEGYGSREMRDGVRIEAAKIGFDVKLIWVDCPAEERLRRVRMRNKNLNDEGYLITEEDFYRMEALDGDLGEDESFTRVDNSLPN